MLLTITSRGLRFLEVPQLVTQRAQVRFTVVMAELMMVVPERKRKLYRRRRDSDVTDYKDLYRFKKQNVEWLVQNFLTESTETRGGALSNDDKMRIFLRCIGDPGFQVGVGEDIGVTQATISNTFWEVAEAIKGKARNWYNFPEPLLLFRTLRLNGQNDIHSLML